MRTYPFTAVVGSDDMALALILTTVSPEVGGVLVRGEKGTAKSTMVRALAALLPAVDVVEGCRFSCDPADPDPGCPDGPHPAGVRPTTTRPARLVELPVGATEDRVIGSLHLEQALTAGVTEYEPGLLAAAHRGLLYVDEVNLLHDHLVDLLLDAAAMGRSTVEREGVSVAHAARFVLVGTMNPEEGELRPQLLDRFGLTVEIAAPRDPALRAEVVRRRLAHDADPDAFGARYAAAERAWPDRIAAARAALPTVVLGDGALTKIAQVCAVFEVDGMRADIVTARAAVAHAAWHGRRYVTRDDIRAAARLALPAPAPPQPVRRARAWTRSCSTRSSATTNPTRAGTAVRPPDTPTDADGRRRRRPRRPTTDRLAAGPSRRRTGSTPERRPSRPPSRARRGSGPPAGVRRPRAPCPARESRFAPSCSPSTASARGSRAGAPGRSPAAAGPSAPPSFVGQAGARAPDRDRPGRRPASASPRPHRARSAGPAGTTCGWPFGRAGSRTWCCSASTRPGRWPPASGWRRSRPRCCPCSATPTSGGTRSGWSPSAVRPPTCCCRRPRRWRPPPAGWQTLPAGGRTPLAEGLRCAAHTLRVERIRDPLRRPLLVVVTDGRATAGTGCRATVATGRRRAGRRRGRRTGPGLRDRPVPDGTGRAAGRASARRPCADRRGRRQPC